MSELPFMKGVKHLHSLWKQGIIGQNRNASIVFQTLDGKLAHSGSQACHGGMGNPPITSSKVEYIISGIQNPSSELKLTREDKITYLKWLLNDSVYAPAFVTKNAEWCLDNEAIVAYPDIPGNLLVAGLQCTRRLWEFNYVVKAFSAFVKAGVNPELAFFLGHGARFRGNDMAFSSQGSDHYPIGFQQMEEGDLFQFLIKEVPKDRLKKKWSEDVAYQGIIKMFCSNQNYGAPSTSVYGKYLKTFQITEPAKKQVVINPFAKAKITKAEGDYKFFPLGKVAKEIAENFQPMIFKKVGYA